MIREDLMPPEVKRLIAQRDEREADERRRLGEEGYAKAVAARDIAIQRLRERVDPLVADARRRGFVYFRSLQEIGARSATIRLQFADGKGSFYERRLGIEKLVKEVGMPSGWKWRLESAIHSYVRSLDGIGMLDHGMQAKRVRANIAVE
jgi:hypothetical protein